MMKDWKCFLMGHKSDFDEYYGYCPRCKKDYNDWIWTLRNHINWKMCRLKIFLRHKIYWRCPDCGKRQWFGEKLKCDETCGLPF
jgi:uncharacterized protein with PIN domain